MSIKVSITNRKNSDFHKLLELNKTFERSPFVNKIILTKNEAMKCFKTKSNSLEEKQELQKPNN